MKNKKGFTLVELLVVITIIGLLVVIAVPSSMTISKKVKVKMYDSKIELIEQAAILWGQENKEIIAGAPGSLKAENQCSWVYAPKETNCTRTSCSCYRTTIGAFITSNVLTPDDNSNDIKNPVNGNSLKSCTIYIYIKNKRVYAKFLKTETGSIASYYNPKCSPSN